MCHPWISWFHRFNFAFHIIHIILYNEVAFYQQYKSKASSSTFVTETSDMTFFSSWRRWWWWWGLLEGVIWCGRAQVAVDEDARATCVGGCRVAKVREMDGGWWGFVAVGVEGLGARDSEGKSLRLLASFHRRDPSWFLGVMLVNLILWCIA